jgi:hypothetical protein
LLLNHYYKMKYNENHFEDYLDSNDKVSLHPKLNKVYDSFPADVCELKNIIFYGPKGVGKYTQMLRSIKKYSPTNLKYEKKIINSSDKLEYIIKLSDIHFEIDMSLLGCNSKVLWNDLYNQIVDSILARNNHTGIIVCKYFHEIHSELLDIFYSYMQTVYHHTLNIKFILLTEQLSFIPNNILNKCRVIRVSRPSRQQYNKCLNKNLDKSIILSDIENIKNLSTSVVLKPYKLICESLIKHIVNIEETKIMEIRDKIYDIFIYNLDIYDSIWYILHVLKEDKYLKEDDISDIIMKVYDFLHYYNNNYRPIYHLERFIFYVINKVHGFDKST